jgi:hypothetical protein
VSSYLVVTGSRFAPAGSPVHRTCCTKRIRHGRRDPCPHLSQSGRHDLRAQAAAPPSTAAAAARKSTLAGVAASVISPRVDAAPAARGDDRPDQRLRRGLAARVAPRTRAAKAASQAFSAASSASCSSPTRPPAGHAAAPLQGCLRLASLEPGKTSRFRRPHLPRLKANADTRPRGRVPDREPTYRRTDRSPNRSFPGSCRAQPRVRVANDVKPSPARARPAASSRPHRLPSVRAR